MREPELCSGRFLNSAALATTGLRQTLALSRKPNVMFAIAYDLDTESLKQHYHNPSYNNAYAEFRTFMELRGFKTQQGSVLYGDETVTAVTATLAIVAASQKFQWLKPSVKDIRILRILDKDDLMPAIESGFEAHKSEAVMT
jgi:virulence-associated protein VapD